MRYVVTLSKSSMSGNTFVVHRRDVVYRVGWQGE